MDLEREWLMIRILDLRMKYGRLSMNNGLLSAIFTELCATFNQSVATFNHLFCTFNEVWASVGYNDNGLLLWAAWLCRGSIACLGLYSYIPGSLPVLVIWTVLW